MKNLPALKLNDKKYVFSLYSLILFVLGAPLLILGVYFFLDWKVNAWLKEVVAKQSGFFLSFFFNLDSKVIAENNKAEEWIIVLPKVDLTYVISTWCTAAHVFSIILGFIMFTPHSRDPHTSQDIVWRKTIASVLLISIIHIANIVRIGVVIYLTSLGFDGVIVHGSINYITGILAALLFVLVVYKWVPEFFIALYYFYVLYLVKKEKKKIRLE